MPSWGTFIINIDVQNPVRVIRTSNTGHVRSKGSCTSTRILTAQSCPWTIPCERTVVSRHKSQRYASWLSAVRGFVHVFFTFHFHFKTCVFTARGSLAFRLTCSTPHAFQWMSFRYRSFHTVRPLRACQKVEKVFKPGTSVSCHRSLCDRRSLSARGTATVPFA